MNDPDINRLHWGCGEWTPPGWINSDRRQRPGVDLVCDILDGLPLATASVDYAVSIHALPEVAYPDLVPVLGELRRVLKPGGVLRLGLPDLMKNVEAFRRGDRSFFLIPDDEARRLGAKLVVQLIWYGHSRTPFTSDFIEEALVRAGFGRVVHCRYRETSSRHPGITALDNREDESLFVEAFK